MKKNKVIITAPFYRGLLLVFISSLFWITLGCIALAIVIIVSRILELIGIIVAVYAVMLLSFIAIKVYQKASKTKIVISEEEIAKYNGSKKIKSINVEDIKSMHFADYSFPLAPFDEFNIYSVEKKRIHFYAPSAIIPDIEQITTRSFQTKN